MILPATNEKPHHSGPALHLSVLDQAPVAEGSSASEALERSVQLAQHVEGLGYRRFWMSEHHAMQTLACSAPEVVLARVGAATRRIRIGSGGIMLPHYAPLKVAESFLTLAVMYPDRVDLGVGRAPGGGPIESQALRRDRRSLPSDDFPEQMAELLEWLGQGQGFARDHAFRRVQVSPALAQGQASPEVWLLGSSLWGAAAAAHWGLPYAFAHFFSPVATRAALESYRNAFMPRHLNLSGAPQLAAPKAVAAVGVIVADSDEEARFLHSSVRLLQRRIRMGDRRPVASPEDATRILRDEFGEQDKSSPRSSAGSSAAASQNGRLDVVMNNEEGEFPRYIVGSPSTVRHELGTMSASLGLSEILVNTIVHDHASRLRSYSLLAAEFASDAQVQADRAEPLSQRAAS